MEGAAPTKENKVVDAVLEDGATVTKVAGVGPKENGLGVDVSGTAVFVFTGASGRAAVVDTGPGPKLKGVAAF